MATSNNVSFRSFVAAFRGQWFATMSGGFSVPFTIASVFVSNDYAKLIF